MQWAEVARVLGALTGLGAAAVSLPEEKHFRSSQDSQTATLAHIGSTYTRTDTHVQAPGPFAPSPSQCLLQHPVAPFFLLFINAFLLEVTLPGFRFQIHSHLTLGILLQL